MHYATHVCPGGKLKADGCIEGALHRVKPVSVFACQDCPAHQLLNQRIYDFWAVVFVCGLCRLKQEL
ncbi:hypothetical protein CBM2587_A70050 [Cupriavidus taiwanensis]|uniref:Uncharacterized protein n=1 Tax=Cupriavidus taiwanensis TaxID=164546 RepID=A0A375BW79_9BURK|nr:hypothetical protein CBM2587_A70050 [Cupriavidus taiwanensis]